jgi:hypothetical protein
MISAITVTSPELEDLNKTFIQAQDAEAFGGRLLVGVSIEGYSVYRGKISPPIRYRTSNTLSSFLRKLEFHC